LLQTTTYKRVTTCYKVTNYYKSKWGDYEKMANPFVQGIISITLGVIMLANVFIPVVKGVSTTNWTAGEVALWGVLGLGGIIGLVYGVFAVFGLA